VKGFIDKRFLKKLALINGLAIFIIVLGPLIIDPRLKSHVQFPNRTYTYQWLWLLMCVPVGFGTYYFGYGRKMRGWRNRILTIVVPALILTLPALAIAFLFPPEFPHAGIVVWAFAYGFVSLLTVFFRSGRTMSDPVTNDSEVLNERMKLERLKATISWWQQISLYAAAGYLAFAIFLASVAWTINGVMLPDNKAERFFFGNMQMFQILLFSVFVMAGPLLEAYRTTQYHINQIASIKLEKGKPRATD